MKSKRLLLMLLMVLTVPWAAQAQETVTIGTGTATHYTNPIGTYYNYSITEQLYTAEEIGMAGTISSVSFYYMGTAARDFPITMYMMNTEAENLSTGISLAEAEEVFSGTLPVTTTAGWVTITLDTPFAYNGTSNLLVGFIKDYLYYFSGQTWRGTATTSTMARYSQSDNNAYTTSTVPEKAQTNRPNIQMEITPGGGPTCERPATFEVSNITGFGADFAWESTVGNYTFEYKKATDSDWTVVSGLTATTYTLSTLEPMTDYSARVKAVCDTELESSYKTANFTTIEVCPDGIVCIGSGTATNNSLPLNNYYNYSLTEQIYTADEIGQAGAILSIDFFKAATTAAQKTLAIYMVSTTKDEFTSNTDWIPVTTADLVYSGTVPFADNDWTTIELDSPFIYDGTSNVCIVVDNNTGAYVANTGFRVFSTAKNQALYQQSDGTNPDPTGTAPAATGRMTSKNRIRIAIGESPACPKPTGLAVSNVGAHTVTLSWTSDADAWQICLNNDEENLINVTENPYTLTGLTAETVYTAKVRANCDNDGFSEWNTNPVSFTTPCEAYNLPYAYSFEDAGELNCWTIYGANSSETGISTEAAHSGSYGFRFFFSEENAYLVSPVLTGTENGIALSFYYGEYSNEYGGDQFYVGYTTDETATDPSSFTYGSITTASSLWQLYETSLPEGTKKVAIKYVYTDASSLYLDDFSFETPACCPKPLNLVCEAYTANTATFTWTNGGSETQWLLEYDTIEDFAGASSIQVYQNNLENGAYTLTGLAAETRYYVRIKAYCPTCDINGGYSQPSNTRVFKTLEACPVPTALTTYNVLPTSVKVNWNGDADGYRLRYKTIENPATATIILTAGDVWGDGSGYQMLLDADANAYGTIIPETGGLTNGGDASEETYAEFEYKIPINADGDCSTQNTVMNNSISIEIPAGTYDWCITNPTPGDRIWIASSSGNVGGRANDYVFEAGKTYEFTVTLGADNHDQIDVVISGGTNIRDDEWIVVEDVTNPHTLSGLLPETWYQIEVQAVCEDGESAWVGTTFHTPELCPTPTNLQANVSMESVLVTWTPGNSLQGEWELQYKMTSSSDWTLVGNLTEPSYTITNLANASGYEVRVRAVCEVESEWTPIVSFTSAQIYIFTTIVDDSIFLIGDTIPIHGTVKDNHNVPVANVDVEIGVTVFGNRRTLETVSDENGEFAVDFIPSSFESGYYTVNSGPIGNADTTAVHDDFDILGMMIGFVENEADTIHYNGYIVCEVTQNDPPKPFVLPVKNKNSIALTNLHVEIISEQPEGSVFNFGTLNLAGFEFGYLPFTVSGTVPTQGDVFQEFMVRVISNEGSKIEFTIMYYCHEATPELNAYPNPIVTTVTRGKSKTLDVTLTNNGTVASGEITVNLPDLEWMSVMDGTTLPSINAGQSSIFTLRLSPDNEVPLGLYEGTIVINTSSGSYVNLSYSITVVSEEEGILLVDVTDEYTTNTNNGNGPHVEGAEVTLTDYYSHETVAHGFTSSTGIFGAEDIPEGWYYLEVDADRHLGYNEIVYISAGTTNRYDIFLPYQGVYFSWSVEETEIIDEYLIELNVEYETDVPVPVLVIDGPSYIPAFESYYDYSFVITNHGLIDATDLTIIPENEMYYLTPLFTYIDTLHAHQSIVVPCRITHKDPEDCGNWEKTVVQYKYLSGQTKISKSSFTYTLIGGQPCDDELPYLGDGDSGSGFGNNSPRPKPRPRPNEPNNGNGGNSSNHHSTPPITHQNPYVSVRFGVQFSQNMTMTREAFIGTFIVYNNEPSATTDIGLDLTVKDELGIDHTNLFEITVTSMDGIDAIDGTGTMSAASNGMVKIQFIPTRGAAPTVPVDYYFGGNFTFTDPQTSVSHTMHLYPTKITVHPSPDLHLDYFVSPVLYGDNPLTPNVIEPSVPAELAVRIKNVGVGTAKNVMIETAEPVIVNNIQNLLIEINHIGTYVDGEGVQLGLHNIDFGNIESGQQKTGEWLFTSSLLARLVSGNVHLVHNDLYDNPRLSLVSHVGIHELTHPIYASNTRAGGAHDFLVNDIPDENNYPDSIFFSNGGKTSVGVAENIGFDKYVTAHDTIVTLTVSHPRVGWNYGETADPGRNRYELVSCVRNNDSKEIPLGNVWQEAMLVPGSGDTEYDYKLRIVDTVSAVQTVTYTLVFVGDPTAPYVFYGDEDENWSNAANWEGNVKPGTNRNALIEGTCLLDENATVRSLTVAEGHSLTIPSGRILTTTGSLASEAASRLVIEDGGQLMHSNAGVQATAKRTIMPYTAGTKDGWHLIAHPMANNVNVNDVENLANNSFDLYYYDEPTVYWINQEDAGNDFTQMETCKGYLYGNSQNGTLGFMGELQNGAATVNVPLVYTTSHALQGFNLVGNPFAHNVTSYATVNVANGCYVMNEAKDDLIVSEINEDNPLKPTEGFFVKAMSENASITFNLGRGSTATQSGTIRVELVENGKLVDRLLVKTGEGQPLEKFSLKERRTRIFAQNERQELAIVPCKGNEQAVNFKAVKNGSYTISVNADGMDFNYFHLVDNLTGADVDLLAEPSYTFDARTSDYASRFLLRFMPKDGSSTDSETFAFISNGNIVIINAEADATLQIVDVMGRVVVSTDALQNISTREMTPGVYVLRLINGNDVKTQKIVVE